MTEFTIYSFTLNLVYCAAAVLALMGVLRIFDKINGITFKACWNEITRQNNAAMAIYLGLRFLAVCILLGSIIS